MAQLVPFKWSSIAQDLYDQYLSKPYSLNNNKTDWDYTHNTVTIPRPNQGLVHTLRTAVYVALVVRIYNKFNKTNFSVTDEENLQLVMLFYGVGRENEASFRDKEYEGFRKNAADIFEKYIRAKLPSRLTEEQLKFYKQAVLNCYENNNHQYLIIRICNDLDLLRCYTRDDYNSRTLKTIAGYTGENFTKELAECAEQCIQNTGDRVTIYGKYNGSVFVKCSQSVQECLQKIDEIFQSKIKAYVTTTPALPPAAPTPSDPIPTDLKGKLACPEIPWNVNPDLFDRVRNHPTNKHPSFKTCEVKTTDPECELIRKYFMHHKPVGFGIKKISCVHHPVHTQVFEAIVRNTEEEAKNPYFAPKWQQDDLKNEREKAIQRWKNQTAQFSPIEFPSLARGKDILLEMRVLPLWHGGSRDRCETICAAGFTLMGIDDYFTSPGENMNQGSFGNGIYFTNSADYASKYSSDGSLIMSWVTMREPYPIVSDVPHPQKSSDMKKLEGNQHYQNYNTHFIPVASLEPTNPKCTNYYPCYKDQPPAFDEFVIFDKSHALPRFLVELAVDSPMPPLSIPAAALPPHVPKTAFSYIAGPNQQIEKKKVELKPVTDEIFCDKIGWFRTFQESCEVHSLLSLKGGIVVSGGSDNTVKLWDTSKYSCTLTLRGHSGPIYSLAQFPELVASGSGDKTIKLWDTSKGTCINTLKGHSGEVFALAPLPNAVLASGSQDTTIKIWDTSLGVCLRTLDGHTDTVHALTTIKGGILISGGAYTKSADTALKVWDINSGNCIRTLPAHSDVISALIAIDGETVASASHDKTIKIWNISKATCLHVLLGHSAKVTTLAVLDGRILISGSEDKSIRLWDIPTGKHLRTFQGHDQPVFDLTTLPGGIFVSGSGDKTIKFWK